LDFSLITSVEDSFNPLESKKRKRGNTTSTSN